MTPTQFQAARVCLGLTVRELGKILNSADRTVRHWELEDGTRPPNPIACRVLQWMLDGYRPPEWPVERERAKAEGRQ
jgi:DNA-binding transcriptional regulator YiaG